MLRIGTTVLGVDDFERALRFFDGESLLPAQAKRSSQIERSIARRSRIGAAWTVTWWMGRDRSIRTIMPA